MRARVCGGWRAGLMGLGLALSAIAMPAQGQDTARLAGGGTIARALPRNTIALFSIGNAAEFRTSFSASQMGRLWDDPAMKPMRDKFKELFEDTDNKLKEAAGLTLSELFELPQGEVALAVLPKDDEKVPVSVVAVADAGDNAGKMAELMNRLNALAEQDGATVTVEEADGLTLHILRSAKAPADAPPIVWTQKETYFGVSTDAEVLKSLAAHAEGRDDSLVTNANFETISRKLGNAPAMFFIDVASAVDLGVKIAGQGGVDADQIKAQMNLLGLSGLKSIGGMIAFNQGEFDSTTKVYIHAPSPRKGVLKLFQMPPADLKPEPWVPEGVVSYASYSLDFDALYAAIGELADQFAPGVLEQMEKSLAEQDGGLNLKADVLAPLGKRVTAIQDYKKPITEESQRMVVAISLKDAKAMQNTLNKVLDLASASPKKRSFQGETIYDFDLPPEAAQSGLTGPISLAIAKDHILVSTEPTLLEQILRGGGPSLAESPAFEAVRRRMPEHVSLIGFSRPDEAVQLLYGMMGGEQFKMALDQMRAQAPPDAPDFSQLFDPKLMPEYEQIKKYLAPGGSYGVPDDDGVTLTQFTLKSSSN